jgi:hypothetical protein
MVALKVSWCGIIAADGHTCGNPSCTRTVTNTAGQTITVGVAVAHHSGGLASLSQVRYLLLSQDRLYALYGAYYRDL